MRTEGGEHHYWTPRAGLDLPTVLHLVYQGRPLASGCTVLFVMKMLDHSILILFFSASLVTLTLVPLIVICL